MARLHPQRARQFARADGQLAKTDRIDAHILALFGQRMQPEANIPEPYNQRYIKALTSRRRFLVARRCAERCQLKQAAFEDIRAMIRRARRLTSLPGIGTLTSAATVFAGGRKDLRNAPYMAALSATRTRNTPFSALYKRLVAAGKPPKLAITAVMRKMVVTLNAMERAQKVYAI